MSREQMLLDRIAACGEMTRTRYTPSTSEDVDALMESVRRNLARVLNARHGMSESAPDYGLPALTDLIIGSADYMKRVQDAIRVAVDKYEPRLRRVRVSRITDEEDQHTLSFRIDGILVGRSGEHRVWYETMVSGDGQFDVIE